MKDTKPLVSVQTVVVVVVFSALSAVGGLIKIPSPVGSIAFDSAPGYFCAAYFSPVIGGFVGLAGHLSSALTAGFPLGLNHVYIGVHMFLWCCIFGQLARSIGGAKGLIAGSLVSLVLNGVASPLLLTVSPFQALPLKIATGLIVVLLLASAANIAVASVAYKAISRSRVPGL